MSVRLSRKRAPVAIERLEDRCCLAAHLTVITHGTFGSDQEPLWAIDMASAINVRDHLGFTETQINNSVVRSDAVSLAPPAGGADSFLIFDWAAKASTSSPGTADNDDVAGQLARMIRARFPASGKLDIQLIGFDRGVYVNLAAINLLNNDADNAHIGRLQMTTLDAVYFDQGAATESQPLVVASNVDYADNYHQTADVLPVGEAYGGAVIGAVNFNITSQLGSFPLVPHPDTTLIAHAEVHDWYHWTIDTDDTSSFAYRDSALVGEKSIFFAQRTTSPRNQLYNLTVDLDNNGADDPDTLGDGIGFYYSLGDAFGPHTFTGSTSLDLVFVIDTTGSMGSYIDAVKSAATDILDAVRTSVPDFRVSIVTYKDLDDGIHGGAGDYQSRTDLAFTNDTDDFTTALDALTASGGGDTPESVYAGLSRAIGSDWRGGSVTKVVILMGDAVPHDPEPGTNFTRSNIAIQAFNADPVNIFTIPVGTDAAALKAFQSLADLANGSSLPSVDPSTVAASILDIISTVTGGSPPSVEIEGPNAGVRGQPLQFTFTATDPDSADNTAGFAFNIDWGDGQTETIARSADNGTQTLSHIYKGTHTFTIHVRAIDQNNNESEETTQAVKISKVLLEPDLLDPSKKGLFIGGGTGRDQIWVIPWAHGKLAVLMGGHIVGKYAPGGSIYIWGQAGNDVLGVSAAVRRSAMIDGGGDNDCLFGGGGKNLLIGGNGHDRVVAGRSQDLMVDPDHVDKFLARGRKDLRMIDVPAQFQIIQTRSIQFANIAASLASSNASEEAAVDELVSSADPTESSFGGGF